MEIIMNKPTFMCVGFSKCGTTTLYELFKQHPDIYLSNIKEPWYYSKYSLYQKGFDWYIKRYYKNADASKIVGEINPDLTSKQVAQKLYKDFGSNLKLIFIMRNPVERLFSNYKMNLKHGFNFEKIDKHLKYNYETGFTHFIKENLKRDSNGKLILKHNNQIYKFVTGQYGAAIQEYLKYFPIENMKFIIFEEFIKDEKKITQELLQFIGVNNKVTINYNICANEGKRVPCSIQSIKACQWVIENFWMWYLKDCPITNYYTDYCISKFREFLYYIFTKKSYDISSMNLKCRKLLQEYYWEDINILSSVIHKDMHSIWF